MLARRAARDFWIERKRGVEGAVVEVTEYADGVARPKAPQSRSKRLFRNLIHFLCYHFVLKRQRTTVSRAAGFRLTVPPTVFHPRYFAASEFFATFIDRLDLAGRQVADVGTGTGILALAAARRGAAGVVAVDINPNAVKAANDNARANGLDDRVTAVCSDLLSALPAQPLFDVILSNPPYFPGEPLDLADRAWHAGPHYRDIKSLFEQARVRLKPGGMFYVILSSDSDLDLLCSLMEAAGFRSRRAEERSLLVESLVIYELRPN
jgi:methylase of polypeptide subunit release factors